MAYNVQTLVVSGVFTEVDLKFYCSQKAILLMQTELQQFTAWLEAERAKARERANKPRKDGDKRGLYFMGKEAAFDQMIDKIDLLLLAPQSNSEIAPPLQQAAVSGSEAPSPPAEVYKWHESDHLRRR